MSAWQRRVDAADWALIGAEVDELGCGLTPQLLAAADAVRLIRLHDRDEAFRSTVDMGRYRFGEGEYRYLTRPFPEPIAELRQALYPRLLPIARDWYIKLGRPTPWPDTLDEWLDMCRAAGQTKPTPLILKYGPGDWNALHRDLYGNLVFPLQLVINLTAPSVDHTGGEFLLVEQRPRAQSRAPRPCFPAATDWCSPPATGPSYPSVAGRHHRSVTGCPSSAPASDSRWACCFTTRLDYARTRARPVGAKWACQP